VPRASRGQIIVQAWPKKRGKNISPVQRAWVNHFSCIANNFKDPEPRQRDFAEQHKGGARWFVRDFFYAAAAGKLIGIRGEERITTPTASLTKLASAAAVNGTDTVITPTAHEWDNNQFWSNTVNPSRMTIRSAGLYLIGMELQFTAVAGGSRRAWLRLNGTTFFLRDEVPGTSSGAQQIGAARPYYFHAGDYVECGYFQNSAGVSLQMNSFWIVAITPESVNP